MRIKSILYIPILSFIVTGCATSSGVSPLGEDSFMISRNGAGFWSSTGQIKAVALKDADAYCIKNGKELQVVRITQHEASGRPGDFPGAEVQFMCLNHNDPALTRTKLKKEADRIIEINQDIHSKKDTNIHKSEDAKSDVYGELIKLDDLRKKGIISDSEFQEQKKKLLDSN